MKCKQLGVAPMALLLSACAHAYPDLATFQSVASTGQADELGPILIEAERLQATYSTGYKETAKWQDIGQLPVIGAAAAAAWILLKDQSGAAKKVGKIGIGTLAYTSARDQLSAQGLPDAYIAGHGALTCILAEGSVFHGSAARERLSAHRIRLDAVANDLALVTALRNIEPDGTPPAIPGEPTPPNYSELLKTARTLADQAVTAARTAQATGLAQDSAFGSAGPTFRNAVSSVSVRVASKGRVRPPIDFVDLRDRMGAAAKPGSATAAIQGNGLNVQNTYVSAFTGDDPKTLVQALSAATNQLIQSTAELVAGTPNYQKSLSRVSEDCTKLAP